MDDNRLKRLIVFNAALFLAGAANAADFTVADDDQKNIAAICELAAQRPGIPIQQTASIANWCVMWGNRMQAAEKAKAAGAKPEDTIPLIRPRQGSE